jgi:phospholipid-transporting ATPase
MKNNQAKHVYLNLSGDTGFVEFLIKLVSYWVAYSHLIPISLYVVLEMVKIALAMLIGKDIDIYDPETGFSICRNSDLIEEMG